MTPIQLWLPEFFGGIARPELRRDMQRMFKARTRENVMWSVPGWMGPPQWTQHGTGVSCMNGDTLECVRILHVGANNAVVGPAAAAFPNLSVKGLLDAWLHDEFVTATPKTPGEPLRVNIPNFVGGVVTMVVAKLTLPGGQFFPFAMSNDNQVALAQWPPRANSPSTVSPEMESGLSPLTPDTSLHFRIAWSAPFDQLQPLVISPDDLLARDRMRLVAEESRKDLEKAFARAQSEAADWISEGRATVNEAWLRPIIAAEGEGGALFAIDGRFGVSANSLAEAYHNRGLQAHLNGPMSVTRAWGVPGLMWALFVDRLSRSQAYLVCERCGRKILGKADKRFCSATDDLACYQSRMADNKRRSRSRVR